MNQADSPGKNAESIKNAAETAAKGMLEYYTGGQPGDVPGNLPDPYYWWECGAMLSALIDYRYYTGDEQFNDLVMQAMVHQTGPDLNYMPPNQSSSMGNDDQAFWGMAALTAAETKFPNPPDEKIQWLALAQAVFNSQAHRWDTQTCGGGLRWQVFTFNNGYTYKNTVSNGALFNMAARLATYTGNATYAEWADKSWDWMESTGLISNTYQAFDGTDVGDNCTLINHVQFTYNNGVLLAGAAHMYKFVWLRYPLFTMITGSTDYVVGTSDKRIRCLEGTCRWPCESRRYLLRQRTAKRHDRSILRTIRQMQR